MALSHSTTRPAAVAGRFYPGRSQTLQQALQRLRESVSFTSAAAAEVGRKSGRDEGETGGPGAGVYKAMIAPHAGYVYSGPVAASGYAKLQPFAEHFNRVALIGPAHYESFTGLAVSSADAFDTPLGSVAVDTDAIAALLKKTFVQTHDDAHQLEHGLEVHLPFLIDLFGGADRFTFVPILFSDSDDVQVAQVLAPFMDDPQTLVVVSSDLSHYLDHAAATQADRATAHAIVAGEPQRIGPADACGYLAIRGLMRLARDRALHCTCIDLRNSGDTALAGPHSRERVVGYGCFLYR